MAGEEGADAAFSLIFDHVCTYHGGSVSVDTVEGKGRVLRAERDFEAGERILLEYPLIEAVAAPALPAVRALRTLREEDQLEFPAIFYWAALSSLTTQEISGACFTWCPVPEETQAQALCLHTPEDAPEPSESVQRLISQLWPDGGGPDAQRLEQLLQVWIYNSFDLDVEDTGNEAGVIFLAAAMMSHSCAPNAAWHLDDSNSFILHARTDINDGEEVTISYLSPADLGLPTEDRRALLESTKGFVCGCERCVTPLDPARSFCCPCCDGEALARVRPGGDPEPGNDADVLVCSACGPLDASKAAPALQVEEEMKQWARSRPEFATLAKMRESAGEPCAAVEADPLAALQTAQEAGLGSRHWIVDALRLAAASRLPSEASGLLRKCLEVQKEGVGHCMTKRARILLELAEALSAEGGLEEAQSAYDEAASTFAILFGDDHPEHLEAAKQAELTRRKLASQSRLARSVPETAPTKERTHRKKRR